MHTRSNMTAVVAFAVVLAVLALATPARALAQGAPQPDPARNDGARANDPRCGPGHGSFETDKHDDGGYVIYFDAACSDFHAQLRQSALAHGYLHATDKLTLIIVNADWETEYAVQNNQVDLAVSRPAAFGESLTAGSFGNIADLFRVNVSRATGGGREVALDTVESVTEKLENPLYPTLLRQRATAAAMALDDQIAIHGRLNDDIEALSKALEKFIDEAVCAEQGGENDSTCAQVGDTASYAEHIALLPAIRADVRRYNRLYQRIEDTLAALPDNTDVNARLTARSTAQAIVNERDLAVAARAAQPAGGEDTALASVNEAVGSLPFLIARLDQLTADLADKADALREAAAEAETGTRALVDTFNGRYAEQRAQWTRGANGRRIEMPLSPLSGQKRVTLSVYGTPAPVQLTLAFPGKDNQDVTVSSSAAPISPAAVPVSSAPEDATFLNSYVFDVHTLYRYKFGAGVAVSGTPRTRYGLAKTTVVETGDDGEETEKSVQKVVATEERGYQFQPLFYIAFYPSARDLDQYARSPWWSWIGGMAGFSLAEPTQHFYLAVNVEPVAGLDLNFGGHWAKNEQLDGLMVNDELGKDDELRVREVFDGGLFFGIGIDTTVFKQLFGIFGK